MNNFFEKNISRRKFIASSIKAAGAIGLTLPLLFNKGCSKSSDELKIGYIPITDASPLLIAHANNYFKEEGLNVKPPVLIRSWSALVEAFLADKVNLVHFLMPIPIWMRYNNHTDVKIMAWDHTNGSAITVRGDTNISDFSDLGGKQIAVPYWYSMHNVILQMALRKHGLTPVIKSHSERLNNNEVNLFILSPPEMPLALAGKKIDGYIVAEPFNALGELKINAKILRFTGDIWKNHPCCVVVMKESLIKEKPVFAQKVLNGVVKAELWLANNRERAANILSKNGKGYLPVDEEIILRVFKGYEIDKYGEGNIPQAIKHPGWNLERIDFQPYPYPSASRFIFEQMKKTLVEGNNDFLMKYETEFIAKDLVETKFVKNAIENIGGYDKFLDVNYDSPWEREEIIEI